MKLSETFYSGDGAPLGDIVVDGQTGHACFRARDGVRPPPVKLFSSVDELRAMLVQLYGKPGTPAAALERAAGLRGDPRAKR